MLLVFLPSKTSRQACRLSQSCETGRPCHVSKGEPDTPGWVEGRSAESGSQQSGTNSQHLVRLCVLVRGVTASCGAAQVALGRRWKNLVLHSSLTGGNPTQPSVSSTLIHQLFLLLLLFLLSFGVFSWCWHIYSVLDVCPGCLNVEGTGMAICCIYLQNSTLNSFYKYCMRLQENFA